MQSDRDQIAAGQAALRQGDNSAAQKHLARAQQFEPRLIEGIYQQAGNLMNAGVPTLARLQYDTVLAADPQRYAALYGRGFSASAMGDATTAINSLESYLKHDTTGPYADAARAELKRLGRKEP